jgi:hypothetical protein
MPECSTGIRDVAKWRMACLRFLISISSNANPEMLKKLRRLRFLIEESYSGENDGSSNVGLQLHQMSYMLRIDHLLQSPGFER